MDIDNIKKHQQDFKKRYPSKSDTFVDKESASIHLKELTELKVFEEGVVVEDGEGYCVRYRFKPINDGSN